MRIDKIDNTSFSAVIRAGDVTKFLKENTHSANFKKLADSFDCLRRKQPDDIIDFVKLEKIEKHGKHIGWTAEFYNDATEKKLTFTISKQNTGMLSGYVEAGTTVINKLARLPKKHLFFRTSVPKYQIIETKLASPTSKNRTVNTND